VQTDVDKEEVLGLGGLYILGTERHESRRIDNQLRGRAGRQGDPGASKFYMALDDDLLRIFQGDKLIGWMERMGLEDDEAIEHRWINKSIEDAQKRVEGHNFQIRKNLLEYDDVMNLQRKTIYDMRRRALEGENIREMTIEALEHLVDDILGETVPEGVHPEQWDVDGMRQRIQRIFTLEWDDTDEDVRDMSFEELRSRIIHEATELYEGREEELEAEPMRRLERTLLLQYTDQHWKDHLLAMDRLRDGIGLRGYGQRNPLLEYKREGTDMFRLMMSMRDEAVISYVLKAELEPEAIPEPSKSSGRQLAADAQSQGALPSAPVAAPTPNLPKMADVQARLAAILAERAEAEAVASDIPDIPDLSEDMEADGEDGELFPPPVDVESTADEVTLDADPAPEVPMGPPQPGPEARAFAEARGLRRNDPCPCGSGNKFKKCCLKPENDPVGAEA
jgi:preprotein translocase subunit SecA